MNIFPHQSDHPLFRYFADDERERIERIGELRTIKASETLINAGDTDSTLYTIEDGRLEIVGQRGGRLAVFAQLGPGDVLGEVSFVDDSPRTVSVRAAEDTTLRAWDKRSLSEALAFEPQLLAKFAVAMCELLVERLRDTAKRI